MALTPTYTAASPYYNTPINSNGMLGPMVYRPVPASSSDKVFIITGKYNLRPDLLAHDLYGNSQLWWVFAARNPNVLAADPLGNFVSGTQIYIPNAAALKNALGV